MAALNDLHAKRTLLAFSLSTSLLCPPTFAQDEQEEESTRADQISWVQGKFDNALGQAKEQKKKIFIYFWADGSAQSGKFYEETLKAEDVTAALESYVSYSAKTNDQAGYDLLTKYGIQTLPASVFVDAEGVVEDAILGYVDAEGFSAELNRVRGGEYTVSHFRNLADDPNDFESQYKLAVKLQDVGDADGFQEIVDAIKEADPKGRSETAALLHFNDLVTGLFAGVTTAQQARQVDLASLYDYAEKARNKTVKWTAWDRIGNTHYNNSRTLEARQAFSKAVSYCPKDKIIYWGHNIARQAWNMREFLPGDDKKAVLKLAKRALKEAEKAVKTGDDGQGSYGYVGARAFDDGDVFIATRLYTLAGAEFMNDKIGKAIITLSKAAKLDPDNQLVTSRLAQFKFAKK